MIGVEQKNLTLATNFSKISSILSAWSNGDLRALYLHRYEQAR
jgi:hypothetical protein